MKADERGGRGQPHAALRWMIRGTGALIALVSVVALGIMLFGVISEAIRNHGATLPLALIVLLLVGGVLMTIFSRGMRMWQKANESTDADFASVFALLLAVAWYHLLPVNLPKVVIDYFGNNPFFAPFRPGQTGTSYRSILSFLAFYLFYRLIKAYLVQVFNLTPSAPPQTPPADSGPTDATTPEFPQRSPLVPL
jgi:hypothetical protein